MANGGRRRGNSQFYNSGAQKEASESIVIMLHMGKRE